VIKLGTDRSEINQSVWYSYIKSNLILITTASAIVELLRF